MSHTPGPWKLNKYGGLGGGRFGTKPVIIDGSGWGHDWSSSELERKAADARLIAAAPRMVKTLELVRSLLESELSGDLPEPGAWDDALTEVRAAIAEAEGER